MAFVVHVGNKFKHVKFDTFTILSQINASNLYLHKSFSTLYQRLIACFVKINHCPQVLSQDHCCVIPTRKHQAIKEIFH